MVEIKDITDFESLFPPNSVIKSKTEFHSPCPFCSGSMGTKSEVFQDHVFWGTDRLIWRLRDNTFWCRVCHREGRGHNGNYFAFELARLFNASFDPLLAQPQTTRQDNPILYWTFAQILAAHADVQREFWYRFGWDDNTIDHFRLGYGTLYYSDGAVNIIPMSIRTPDADSVKDLYYVSGRREGLDAKRIKGSIHNYFWFINEDPESKVVAFTEGEKDAITAWVLGYRNIVATFGTEAWSFEKTKFLKNQGFETVHAFGDNDEAGSSLNRRITAWGKSCDLPIYSLIWDNTFSTKFDITNGLETLGKDKFLEYIKNNLNKLEVAAAERLQRPNFIPDYKAIDPNYTITEYDVTPLDELRGHGENSTQQNVSNFLSTYPARKRRGAGIIKLLNVPPGGGKTHTLVRVAEKIALEANEEYFSQKRMLGNELRALNEYLKDPTLTSEERQGHLDQIQHLEKLEEELSCASVLIATQFKSGYDDLIAAGANSNLFYNYHARDASNCKNFELVGQLGQKNHDIGTFCAVGCPFKDWCKQDGYLSQESQRRSKPVTVFRHQHLLNKHLVSEYKELVIVDEAPFHILENPLTLVSEDISPYDNSWMLNVPDENQQKAIELFAGAVSIVLNYNRGQRPQLPNGEVNPNYMISGARFLKLLDTYIKEDSGGVHTLETLIKTIDPSVLEEDYQPTYKGGENVNIHLRCMPMLYSALQLELDSYVADTENVLPSFLHLVSGKLEIYQMEKLWVSSSTPVIAADATAMIPEMYSATFKRELDIFSPTIRNPNAEVVVIRGTDWTLSQLEQKLGRELRDREKRLSTRVAKDITGEDFFLDDIPSNPELYDSKLLKDAIDMIVSLAERHSNMLVVVHKKWRNVIEDILKYSYPKTYRRLAFGHYGALRGTNAFKDYEAVVLIGVARIPYDALWRRIQAWGRLLEINEEIPFKMGYYPSPYHNTTIGHSYWTFEHPFARRFADMIEIGEMIQCQERIRPHASSEKKTIYVSASRPSANYVSKVLTKTELLNYYRGDSKINRMKQFMINSIKNNKIIPTKHEMMNRFECGYNTYKKVKDEVERELGITIESGRR